MSNGILEWMLSRGWDLIGTAAGRIILLTHSPLPSGWEMSALPPAYFRITLPLHYSAPSMKVDTPCMNRGSVLPCCVLRWLPAHRWRYMNHNPVCGKTWLAGQRVFGPFITQNSNNCFQVNWGM